MKPFHSISEIQILLDEYKAEYKRTTGKEIGVALHQGWITLTHPSGGTNKIRLIVLRGALAQLKERPTHISFDKAE